MAWHEELLKAGGVAAGAIGLIGVAVTGAVTYLNNERVADNQRTEITRRYDLERGRDREKQAEMLCEASFAFLQDETPNPLIARGDRQVLPLIVRNLENCAIRSTSDSSSGEKR